MLSQFMRGVRVDLSLSFVFNSAMQCSTQLTSPSMVLEKWFTYLIINGFFFLAPRFMFPSKQAKNSHKILESLTLQVYVCFHDSFSSFWCFVFSLHFLVKGSTILGLPFRGVCFHYYHPAAFCSVHWFTIPFCLDSHTGIRNTVKFCC